MARTKPVVPVDESPVSREMVSFILSRAPEPMVLVGGQALAFWMDRFSIAASSTATSDFHSKVTSDVDFLGSAKSAALMADALNGRLIRMNPRALTSLAAQVRIRAATGLEHNIDVLHLIFDAGGLRKSNDLTRKAIARAVIGELEDGHKIRILHPLDVLATRINNAAGLIRSKGPHVLTQARWAIRVAYAAIQADALSPGAKKYRPGAMAQEVFRLSAGTAGRTVRLNHGIDAAAAIPFDILSEHVKGFAMQGARMIAALKRQGRWPLAVAVKAARGKSSRRRIATTPAATNKSKGK